MAVLVLTVLSSFKEKVTGESICMRIAGRMSKAHLNPNYLNGTLSGPQKHNVFDIDTATFYNNLVYQSSKHPEYDHLTNYKV